MRKLFFLLFFITVNAVLVAQIQNPPRLSWKQINTEHFQVVCPESILSEGKRAASLLESYWLPVNTSLHENTKPISVFVFNQSVISNGYTRLGPRQIVFYTTPFQDPNVLGNTEWIELLSIHEYRHAVQFSKLDQGFTGYVGKFTGDIGRQVCMFLSTPLWVMEGDAVCTETALTNSGRGRLPSFNRDIRALELENKRYSYNQAYIGSYKVFFPNHYYLGYLMTSHIRSNYGDDTWNSVLNNMTSHSFWPFTMSGSLHKYTGFRLNKTYNNTLNEFDSIWTAKVLPENADSFDTIQVTCGKTYTNYSYPFFVGKDSVLTIKTGFNDITSLTLFFGGREKKLMEINPMDRIHSNGKEVVWSTNIPDVRWGERSYSDIVVYDIKSNKKSNLTFREKYFAPAISYSGDYIAVVEYGTEMKCSLKILNTKDGSVYKSLPIEDGHFVNMPCWSSDDKQIFFVESFKCQKTISSIVVETGERTQLFGFTNEVISSCLQKDNYVFYGTSIQGTDGIAVLNLTTNEVKRIITGTYGVYNPSFNQTMDSLVFEFYTTGGFRSGIIPVNPVNWTNIDQSKNTGDQYFRNIVELEKDNSIWKNKTLTEIDDLQVKDYKPLLSAIKIHSWYPYPVTGNGIGFSVISNDKLNTLAAKAGVEYFPSTTATREYLSFSYSGLFPVIKADLSNGQRYTTFSQGDSADKQFGHTEKLARIGVLLPFDFSRNVYSTILNLEAGYSYSQIAFNDDYPLGMLKYQQASGIDFNAEFSNKKYKSKRQYYPRLGQEISLLYRYAGLQPGPESLNSFSLNSTFYFPGILRNHNILIMPGYENRSTTRSYGAYWLSDQLVFTRGYETEPYNQLKKLTAVYSMPLFYPDFSIGRVFYCNRIRGDLFYDYGQTYINNGESNTFQSAGIDLNADIYLASIPIPFEVGVRLSHRLNDKTNWLEILLFGVAF